MIWTFPYYDVEKGIDFLSLERDCQWFRDMLNVEQDHIWHAEGDVQIHTKMVVSVLISLPEFKALNNQEKHIMVVAALMHDIEKRSTTVEEYNERENRVCIIAPKHAQKGEFTAREILYKDFNTPRIVRELICKIIRYHGMPLWDITDDSAKYRIIKTSTMVTNSYLAMIAQADILGRTCHDKKEQLEKIEFFEEQCRELDCWDKPYEFTSDLAKFEYLSNGSALEYVPFDDKKFTVTMMSALPGSGKDTYISKNLSHLPMVSLDDIRTELKIRPTDKKGNGKVIQLAKERAKEFMRKGEDFVWNATNITKQLRSQLIDLFTSYGGRVNIVYVEVPYNDLIRQNGQREDVVPRAVIDKMIRKLEPPTECEVHKVINDN